MTDEQKKLRDEKQELLDEYEKEYRALLLGKKKLSYSVGTRSATDFASRIDKLEKAIKKLEQEIAVLEGRSLRWKYDFRPIH